MIGSERIEAALHAALEPMTSAGCPPRLARAIEHAVFPGGHRLRPRLCYAVAVASGGPREEALLDAAAAAVEMMHCASLVHDDLPCFDDAPTRRGVPSVHRAFDEATAVLVGDALIIGAFATLARGAAGSPDLGRELVARFAYATGAPAGLVAGQAWEGEPAVDLTRYHRAKTAVLFEIAAVAGALASGQEPGPWEEVGRQLGLAYQLADDLRDEIGDAAALGKPVGKDAALGRPSASRELGPQRARALFEERMATAAAAVPPVPGRAEVQEFVRELLGQIHRSLERKR